MRIGEYVKLKRTNMGYSTNKLSEMSGLSTGHISDIENDRRNNYEMETLQKLAKGLCVVVEDLLKADKDKTA